MITSKQYDELIAEAELSMIKLSRNEKEYKDLPQLYKELTRLRKVTVQALRQGRALTSHVYELDHPNHVVELMRNIAADPFFKEV